MHANVPGTRLDREALTAEERERFEAMLVSPVTILQIGEGNFLRGFFDWMIHECRKQGLFQGSVAVVQPRPSGKAKMEQLIRQDGLFTLLIRGLERGNLVERRERVAVFSQMFDPYAEWAQFLTLAENPDLQFIVSNTTEAGLTYQPLPWEPGMPMESFPGKLTVLLYRRFQHFKGDPGKGLILLPCELLERNGYELKRCVVKHSRDWGLPDEFIRWVERHNRFLNSLVDRIVTGYPAEEAPEWFEAWGYEDELLNTAEPYYLWAIEGEPELGDKLPLRQAGLNVHWVDDLMPYQMRKVRILNGAHTLMAPLCILHGLDYVREVLEHPVYGTFVREAIEQEIIPSIPLDRAELTAYSDSVIDRFLNPFIRHRLSDISINSISKFKVRLLPSLEFYLPSESVIPERILRAFAGLIRFYKVKQTEKGYIGSRFDGSEYTVRDDPKILDFFHRQWLSYTTGDIPLKEMVRLVLGNVELWGKDLTAIEELVDAVSGYLEEMEGEPQ